jgi:hypothetical protein
MSISADMAQVGTLFSTKMLNHDVPFATVIGFTTTLG